MAQNETTGTPETTTTTQVTSPETAKKAKPEGQVGRYQEVFQSPEEATKEANGRTKGPNRAFTASITKQDGSEVKLHIVAGNWDRAAGIAFMQAGGKVEEIGKPERSRSAKPVGVDGIMAALQALPEAERAAVMASLSSLANKGTTEAPAAPPVTEAPKPAPKPATKK